MKTGETFTDEEIAQRFSIYHTEGGKDRQRQLAQGQIPYFRDKWGNLSEYVKDLKQRFTRYYNKKQGKKGYFWSDRFKSVLVEEGDTLINCLAYIELNACRAGLVTRPEEYRWCSLGYHVQTGNKEGFLSLDFGLPSEKNNQPQERLRLYRKYVYEKGGIEVIDKKIMQKEKDREFDLSPHERFLYRTRYFTDSGIIGSKAFVKRHYLRFKHFFTSKEKSPKAIKGLQGIYSLKRLSENTS